MFKSLKGYVIYACAHDNNLPLLLRMNSMSRKSKNWDFICYDNNDAILLQKLGHYQGSR